MPSVDEEQLRALARQQRRARWAGLLAAVPPMRQLFPFDLNR